MTLINRSIATILLDYLQQKGVGLSNHYSEHFRRRPVIHHREWQHLLSTAAALARNHAFILDFTRHLVAVNLESAESALAMPHAFGEGSRPKVALANGQLIISWPLGHDTANRHWAEFLVALALSIARAVGDADLNATTVHFSHSPPECRHDHDRFFGCKVRFNEPAVLMNLPIEAALITQDGPRLAGQLDSTAEDRFRRLSPLGFERYRLRAQLMQMVGTRRGRLDVLADCNQLSMRSMQRRLTLLGTSFQDLLDEARCCLAVGYLADPRLGLQDVTVMLGYMQQPSFTRAFHRWSGKSPKQWRASHPVWDLHEAISLANPSTTEEASILS